MRGNRVFTRVVVVLSLFFLRDSTLSRVNNVTFSGRGTLHPPGVRDSGRVLSHCWSLGIDDDTRREGTRKPRRFVPVSLLRFRPVSVSTFQPPRPEIVERRGFWLRTYPQRRTTSVELRLEGYKVKIKGLGWVHTKGPMDRTEGLGTDNDGPRRDRPSRGLDTRIPLRCRDRTDRGVWGFEVYAET